MLTAVVAKEAAELGGNDMFLSDELQSLFSMLKKQMRKELRSNRRREPSALLQFWKNANSNRSALSPITSNKIEKAGFSSQASSAVTERLLSDLERHEGR